MDLPIDVTLDWTREDEIKSSDHISAYSAEAGGASVPPSHRPCSHCGRWKVARQAGTPAVSRISPLSRACAAQRAGITLDSTV